jgi:hypothetical protein
LARVSGAELLLKLWADEITANANHKRKTERASETKTPCKASMSVRNGRLSGMETIGLRKLPLRGSA